MSCRDKHIHKCTQGYRSFSMCRFHSATHTTVRVLSLHPPPLILKGQGSSPCQIEFIHSRSSTNVILTKLTVRVGEYRECQGSPPTSPSGCVFSFTVSCFCYILCINTGKWLHTSRHGFFSVFICLFSFLICLEVRRRKHVMRFSLIPAIILTQSSASLALLRIIWLRAESPWCCLWKLVCQTPYTWRKNWDKERKRNRWQLTSPLYADYLKSFDSQHKNTLGVKNQGGFAEPMSAHSQMLVRESLVSGCIKQVRLRAAWCGLIWGINPNEHKCFCQTA